jgi:hypothetical protein
MKKITNFISGLVLWLWSIFIKNSVTKVAKATSEFVVSVAKIPVPRIISHEDNFKGKQLQKNLLMRGIIVILYKLQRRRSRYGTYFIMPVVNPNAVVTACINADPTKKSRVDIANGILLKGLDTTWVSIPPGLITPLAGMIAAVNNAPTDKIMNAAWFILNPQLKKIMAVVQEGMDADRVHSEIICEFYGFHVKGKASRDSQHFEGFTGTVTGTADMLAPVGPNGCAYAWIKWDVTRTIPTIIKVSTYAHCTLTGQASLVPLNISVNAIIGEDVVEESGIIEVVPK